MLDRESIIPSTAKSKLTSTRCSLPCMVSWCWLCCRSMVLVTSSRAESRLQQRGWSSLDGLMASSFSSSDAELRRAGFLSRARSRKERMSGLQSSAMSSRGGACLWICQEREKAAVRELHYVEGKKTKLIYIRQARHPNSHKQQGACKTHLVMVMRDEEDCHSSACRGDHAALLLHDSSFTRKWLL